MIYQGKIETSPTVTIWYHVNKPSVVGNDLFFAYAASGGYGNVHMHIWSIETPSSPALQATYGGSGESNNI